MDALQEFSRLDVFAFLFFIACWFGHLWLVHGSSFHQNTITGHMNNFRVRWMRNMVARDAKVVDALIQNSLQQGVLFFASTSILLVGALLAGLGASDQAIALLKDLPFSSETTRAQWELKILLVALIFVFAFFKFAWSYRLFNYMLIMVGASPENADSRELDAYAIKVADLHALAAKHFTIGLNAYFYSLPAIAWLLNTWLFILATIWVTAVLLRRAFRSHFVRILTSEPTTRHS